MLMTMHIQLNIGCCNDASLSVDGLE